MGGFHEQCAKAFCLALMRIALADNRRCYIMLFSSDIVQHELTADDGIDQAIRFLSQRFRGDRSGSLPGTDQHFITTTGLAAGGCGGHF